MKITGVVCSAAAAVALFASAGSLVQQAPARMGRLKNPLAESAAAARAGDKLYARECASCHGVKREGSVGVPPLDRADIHRAAPGALFWVLRNGSLRRGMPSFAHLPEAQRWQIITFLQQHK